MYQVDRLLCFSRSVLILREQKHHEFIDEKKVTLSDNLKKFFQLIGGEGSYLPKVEAYPIYM